MVRKAGPNLCSIRVAMTKCRGSTERKMESKRE